MTALVQAISRFAAARNVDSETLKLLTVFCLTGLVISLIFATGGADYPQGFAP
jgi:hypothetical protein